MLQPDKSEDEQYKRISPFVKYLVLAAYGLFAVIALKCVANANWSAAASSGVLLLVLFPLVLEVCYPGRYLLRPPPQGGSYRSLWSLKQFLKEHPGWDGKLMLGALVGILLFQAFTSVYYFFVR